jgi:nucleoid-associated protein YgaU
MARCPYGQHRILLAEDCTCKRCGGDLRLYAAARELPVQWYNEARQLWDTADWAEAGACLHAALKLRPDFPEALWLLGLIEGRQGLTAQARQHLSRAHELGANADPDWLTTQVATTDAPAPDIAPAHNRVPPAPDNNAPEQMPAPLATANFKRWRWPAATAVLIGLIGFLIGTLLPPSHAPVNAPPSLALSPVVESTAATVQGQEGTELATRAQQALKSAAGIHGDELRITQVGPHALKVEGRTTSVKEKVQVETVLRSLPGVEAVDIGRLQARERYVVRQGDTLWLLAAKLYHDPTQWQRIAAANTMAAPYALHPGAQLIIPDVAD